MKVSEFNIDTFDLMAAQTFIGVISFILFAFSGNIPAMILSLTLSLTAMQYANEVA
jgi:hypothetical protein